ncbi:DNA helicase UvrBC [Candidatus Poribacteria bacterium]|nr:DNA helicase UvrBC [Candidatus Poribacteria bacterium]
MENNQIEEEIDPRIIEALDDVLEELSFDADQQVRVLQTCDDREVIIIQPNAFTISRIYATGRPDGRKPQGFESYHSYLCKKLDEYERQHGSDEGFSMETEEWQMLFDECYDRYIRYLLFAGIKRWTEVKQDTDQNLGVADMAYKYASPEITWQIYQYKGYILMMNSIARAELALQINEHETAQQEIDKGIQKIGEFCAECLREGYDEAENITRERYLQNLIEFRTDLNSITNQSELEVIENSEVAVAEEHEIRYDGGEDDEFLDELEILLQEMTNN